MTKTQEAVVNTKGYFVPKATKIHTTSFVFSAGQKDVINEKQNDYIIKVFREKVDLLIESFNMYQKFDSITFDFTKDERRK